MGRVLPPAFVSADGAALDVSDSSGQYGHGATEINSPKPFEGLPSTTAIITSVVVRLALLICGLTLVGVVLTSASATHGVRNWDASISSTLAHSRSGNLMDLAKSFSSSADTRPILAIMALVTITLAACRQWRAMLLVPVAMFVEITGFLAVNYLVGRPRPDVSKIGPIPHTYSFPSGHVAALLVCWFGCALLLYAFERRALATVVAAVAVVMTLMTGWARVYLGMHHTLDVAFGLVLGGAALTIAAKSLNMRVRTGFPSN